MTETLLPQVELLRAVSFAAERHRDQKRKGKDKSPYINHPIAVAETLASAGISDLATLQAAILHDTIEDTETTADELEKLFGAEVRDLVVEVTDDKTLCKRDRKLLQIEHGPHLSEKAKMIKIADKICNIYDVIHVPPTDWSLECKVEYLDWAEKVVAGCRGVDERLEERFDEVLQSGRDLFDGASESTSQIVVLRDIDDARGSQYLKASLRSDGDLVIQGQDLGSGVNEIYGFFEYEWAWTIRAGDVPKLHRALQAKSDVLSALSKRFTGDRADELQSFLDSEGIPYEAWGRIGD